MCVCVCVRVCVCVDVCMHIIIPLVTITLSNLPPQLEETRNLDSLNVQELLLDMRKQRFGLIQTPDQLRFSYIAILQVYMHLRLYIRLMCFVS